MMVHLGRNDIPIQVLADMDRKGVDVDLTLSVLSRLDQNDFGGEQMGTARLPEPDDPAVIDCSSSISFTVSRSSAVETMRSLETDLDPARYSSSAGTALVFDSNGLKQLGIALSPLLSFGVLNGGSATSYADATKNTAFDASLYAYYRKHFATLIEPLRDLPKGLTPAFVQPDGTPGPSFLELKMRGLLAGAQLGSSEARLCPYLPMYQMTSAATDLQIREAYGAYQRSPLIRALQKAASIDVTSVETAIQPMITAYSNTGGVWSIFSAAFERPNTVLPLPGGHGQCFATLKPVFQSLRGMGKRYVLLGNVDNLGNIPKPEHLALLALKGAPAGFEFAYRTPVDIKGGVLVRGDSNRITCADIGPAISWDEVMEAEKNGCRTLFNCATGLFSLDYLLDNIDRIIKEIPLRVSRQEKDAGVYWQAEQITWEVMSLMDRPLVFGVNKYERFLAAKLFVECLLTSGIGLQDPDFPATQAIGETARNLHAGLRQLLKGVYKLKLADGMWTA